MQKHFTYGQRQVIGDICRKTALGHPKEKLSLELIGKFETGVFTDGTEFEGFLEMVAEMSGVSVLSETKAKEE